VLSAVPAGALAPRPDLPVTNRFSSHSRTERLIAAGRVALAAFSLLAWRLDPSEPARYARRAYGLLNAYVLYALILFASLWVLRQLPNWWKLAMQILDLAAFLVFMYFTEGPGSPFFMYFTFSLACATLRWQWRGTLWTAVAAIPAFLAMGLYASEVLHDPAFQLNRFIVRSAYLVIVAVLLGYLGTDQEKLTTERSRLAAWPRRGAGEALAVVRELLDHAAGILQAPRMLMIWDEREEPWTRVARRSDDKFDLSEEPLGTLGPLVIEPLTGKSFLCANAGSDTAQVVVASRGGAKTEWKGPPLDAGLQARFGIGPVLSWSLHGEAIEGRLFALDKPGMTWDDLVLGQIVARLAVARMDHLALRERMREAAAAEERIRLSRDLHDGLLQSLTGVALQLQVSRRLLDRDPSEARERLAEIQAAIASEQRDLRSFVNRLKPAPLTESAGWDLGRRLEEVCNRIERQWGLRVKLSSQGLADELPPPVSEDVFRIVHEALVNAARHAGASSLGVDVSSSAGAVFITVTDDGRGFSFHGTHDLATLQKFKAGPITLKERISALGGDLVISSSKSGSRLSISLPLPQTVA
jgi:signal transduction histidine kinase